jgi:hypothetical protein
MHEAMNGIGVVARHALDSIAKAVAQEGAAFGVSANLICTSGFSPAQAHLKDAELLAEDLPEVADWKCPATAMF